MNRPLMLGAAITAALGLATSASAFTFSPVKKTFTATGPAALTLNGVTLNCTATFTGKVAKTGAMAKITGASFTDATGSCAQVIPADLPWMVKPTGAATISINHIAASVPACGPAKINATLGGGTIGINTTINPGACMINASLNTSPTISIVP
ncbi:MAG: hypothetical protein H0X27_04560 [Caulobacteraceae bacterium]|nr:hypothetical protein [Caulobacteraceae bacterium]